MAKYTESGCTITLDLEDGKEPIVADAKSFAQNVQDYILAFGLRTLMRNATAGKLEDDVAKARTSVEQRVANFAKGVAVSEGEAKAKAELSEDERNEVIRNVIVMAKKAQGDARPAADIITAFNGLADEQRKGVLEALAKVIDKQMKAKLREKKQTSKLTAGTSMAF